jgi:hypothetical protein
VPDRAYEIDPNPYAASAVAEPYVRCAPTEVGLWRDGQLVVMHVGARWPAICVKTGEPAVGSHTVKVFRMVPGSWWRREEIDIPVPLGPRWHWLVTRLRRAILAPGLVVFAMLAALQIYSAWHPGNVSLPLVLGAAVLTVSFLIAAVSLEERVSLRLRRNRGNYVWLTGAREPFLAQLPPWPSG